MIICTLCLLISSNVFAQDLAPATNRQAFFGAGVFLGTSNPGIVLDAGTLWNNDFGWIFSVRFKPSGVKEAGVNYYTAKSVFNDTEGAEKTQYSSVSIGRTYGFNDNFFVSGSIGYQTYKVLASFHDRFGILGDNGDYAVIKDSNSNFKAEANLIYSLPGSPACFNLGYSNGIDGFSIGAGWTF